MFQIRNYRTAQVIVLMLSTGMVSSVMAEISSAREEYLYGPETAKTDACNLALDKAKMKALGKR